ncbi:hypothetical protein SDC9_81502 [bioreactor metagenome]|uniref:DUF2321 domain-containing protein n=1 Tax=bioreactor metagenome TaxID=1076179 RepID=A0A644Z2C7_9ZZZZ
MFQNRYLRTYYDTAQICKGKHLINKHANSHPESNLKRCSKCGQETYTACPICSEPIRGCKHTDFEKFTSGNMITGSINTRIFTHCQSEPYEIPLYCQCGSPYPWTEAMLNEFDEIIDMADELNDDEKIILKEKFPQLLIDSTGTTSAALRISKILKSAEFTTIQALKSAVASKIAGHALELLGWK